MITPAYFTKNNVKSVCPEHFSITWFVPISSTPSNGLTFDVKTKRMQRNFYTKKFRKFFSQPAIFLNFVSFLTNIKNNFYENIF